MCRFFEDYLPGPKRTVFHTKKGLSWRNAWGVLRYSANNAFLAFVHAQQVYDQGDKAYAALLFTYGMQQINYMLGDSGRSYVVGFGKGAPHMAFHKWYGSQWQAHAAMPVFCTGRCKRFVHLQTVATADCSWQSMSAQRLKKSLGVEC